MSVSKPRRVSRPAKPSKPRSGSTRRPEQALQQQVVAFIDAAYPQLLFFHPANSSGNRGPRLGAILKSMGVRAGVPDLVLVLPNGLAGFLELKAGKGRLTPAQAAFRDRAKALGCLWEEARSLPEVEGVLNAWLGPFLWTPKARIAA